MIAVLLSLILSVFVSGLAWLLLGSRLRLDSDPKANDLLNLGVYAAIAFPPLFAAVFLGLAR